MKKGWCTLESPIPIHNISGMGMPFRKQYLKDILMIIDFSLSRNNYHEILEFYGDWTYQCPVCGAKHHLIRHGYYERYLIFPGDDAILECICMTVLRLKCTSCGSTQAVLPMDIIPFHQFSVQAVLIILLSATSPGSSVPKAAGQKDTSYQLVYIFLALYRRYESAILLMLRKLGIWESDVPLHGPASAIFLTGSPPPFPQMHFFKEHCRPLFLSRQDTAAYPLHFTAAFPASGPPT